MMLMKIIASYRKNFQKEEGSEYGNQERHLFDEDGRGNRHFMR